MFNSQLRWAALKPYSGPPLTGTFFDLQRSASIVDFLESLCHLIDFSIKQLTELLQFRPFKRREKG